MSTFTLSVPDMSCGHCRASIDAALTPLGAKAEFDMPARKVTISGAIQPDAAVKALDAIGFDAQPVAG